MLGSRLYWSLVFRLGLLPGTVFFGALYLYAASLFFTFFMEGWSAFLDPETGRLLSFNLAPQAVMKSLYYHWLHWLTYKDQLGAEVWFKLFVAMILPFFMLLVIEVVGKIVIQLVLSTFGIKPPKKETQEERAARIREEFKEQVKMELQEEMRREGGTKQPQGSTPPATPTTAPKKQK